MDIIVAIIVIGSLIIVGVSFSAIKYVAHRPANGELYTLAELDKKITRNNESVLRHLTADISHVHITNN
jgi:hypothetical protein